ncbi:hypothetical protein TCSYLVIO_001452 [Trypanosoma cruzi]|uniref:Uncharacterized protein n=1 Tax=Trypanosoma cruzi TaxID=5693 RepID=A0A2V2VFZ2_TRYCR|nr:hypothetical protein TCSYLVIO_001452 [Trypanosoma cruzi]PBJ79904.1 hypothetical protein BCY84_02327 [Trypanosoma cruzi cruzi]PWU94098.1 hypothetical protein C4B63_28g178 [Trypanosoma cruzi]
MPLARRYFYYLNERGHLFHVFDIKGLVEHTRMPSGPTYLRDRSFLDFFYRRLQHNSLEECVADGVMCKNGTDVMCLDDGTCLAPQEFLRHFPYVSLCGVERNFVKVQDSPVVFTDYEFIRKEEQLSGVLLFAGSLQEPFQPAALTVTREGKLFHPITTLKRLQRGTSIAENKGLVGAQVSLKLGFDFVCEELDNDGQYVISWGGKRHFIPYVAQ